MTSSILKEEGATTAELIALERIMYTGRAQRAFSFRQFNRSPAPGLARWNNAGSNQGYNGGRKAFRLQNTRERGVARTRSGGFNDGSDRRL